MAPILSRLLSHRKHSSKSRFTDDFTDSQSKKLSKFESEKRVRLVLYRDCHLKGRKLLFDSKTIKRKIFSEQTSRNSPARQSPLNLRWNANTKQLQPCPVKQNKRIEISEGGVMYEYLQPSPDTTMLGEMILGSVALSYQGSMKVHTMRFPSQLMLSMVFPAPIRESNKEKSGKENSSMHNSTSEININNKLEKSEISYSHSVPMDVPGAISFMTPFSESSFAYESHQSSVSNASTQSHPFLNENSSLTHSSSFNNLHRRKMRNYATSLEYGIIHKTDRPSPLENLPGKRKVNLGLSIIINLEKLEEEESLFEDFFFSHINLIECHMHKLKQIVTDAYFQGRNFIDNIYKGFEKIMKIIQDLYVAPRLQCPMWLTMMTSVDDLQTKCNQLIEEFVSLLEDFDTKSTNFFVSTLLTAILTYHLSWVSTVVPSKAYSHQNFHQKNKSKWMDQVAKSHSYNPLWMQLGDVYGAADYKPKLTRIVVTGKKMNIIYRFLYVFSYFIRCCDVYEKEQDMTFSPENYDSLNERDSAIKLSNSSESPDILKEDEVNIDVPLLHCSSSNSEKFNGDLQYNKNINLIRISDDQTMNFHPNKVDNEVIPEIKLINDICGNDLMACKVPKNSLDKEEREKILLDDKIELKKLLYCEKYHSSQKSFNLPNHNCKQFERIFKEKQNVGFFIGENPKFDQQIWNNFATKEERLKWHDFVCKANHFLCKECKDKELCEFCEHFKHCKMFNTKPFQDLLLSYEENSYKDHLTNYSLKNINKIENITSSQKCINNLGKRKSTLNALLCKTDHAMDNSNLFANSLFTVNEIEESGNDISGNSEHSKTCETANSSDESTEKYIHSIDNSKLFMQEYHNLRFTPEKCLSLSHKMEKDVKKNIESNYDNYYIRSESPEEGYHSMEDTKHNQTEFCLKSTNAPFCIDEQFDTLPMLSEMPFLRINEKERRKENVYRSFGWSLMAGITDHFMSCFCLQGIHGDFRNRLNYKNLRDEIIEDLVTSSKFSFIGDVSEAICILADTDHWKIELLSSNSSLSNTNNNPIVMSPLVSEICESLSQMFLLDISSENCIMYLESRLQELYLRSLSLAEFLNNSASAEIDIVAKSLKLDPCDIPLLLAVVSRPTLDLAY